MINIIIIKPINKIINSAFGEWTSFKFKENNISVFIVCLKLNHFNKTLMLYEI